MNKIMSSIVNKPFMVKVNEEGTVLEVSGFDKIVNDMIDSLGLDEQQKQTIRASMKDQFSEEKMRENFAEMNGVGPFYYTGHAVRENLHYARIFSNATCPLLSGMFMSNYGVRI